MFRRIALAVAIAWFLFLPLRDVLTFPDRISVLPNLETDAAAYDAFAREFARTWQLEALPSKHPPGWMIVLATVYAFINSSYVAGKLVSWLALIVIVIAGAWLAHRVFGRIAGVIAALLCASSPGLRGYVGTLQYEVLTAALFLVFLVLTIRTADADSRALAYRRALWAGVVGGALVLTRETFVLVVPIAALWLWQRLRPALARDAPRVALVVVAIAAAPAIAWSAAQTLHYERLILISEKGPKEFELGNNPLANGTYNEPLVGMIEPAGIPFIQQYPLDALRLAGRKVLYMFGVLRDGWAVPHPAATWIWRATTGVIPLTLIEPAVAGGWLLVACVISIVLLRREGRRRWWVLLVSAAAILAVHVITIGSYRFAMPLLPLFYVLASGPLAAAARVIAPALRTRAVAAGFVVLLSVATAAQFQRWPLRVSYDAAALEGVTAANTVDEISGTTVRSADAARGLRPVALLPDTHMPRGALRVSARLRKTTASASAEAPVARVSLTQLNGRNACVADVLASHLRTDAFTDVSLLCDLDRDGPATLAVFSTGVEDLSIDSIDLAWR